MERTFEELVREHDVNIYTKYKVTMVTANRLLGGWPKHPESELAMLEARHRKGLVKDETVEAARARVQEMSSDDDIEESEKAKLKSWTGFKAEPDKIEPEGHGIFLETRQLKAGFKETATVLGLTNVHRGVRQILQHSFFIRGCEHPDRVYLYDKGHKEADRKRLVEPDGHEETVAHVIGPQGPRSTIKFHDYVEPGTYIEFEIWFADPKDKRMSEEFLTYCMQLAQDNGFGCSRSQGFGRVKFLTVEELQKGSLPKPKTKAPKTKVPKKGKAA